MSIIETRTAILVKWRCDACGTELAVDHQRLPMKWTTLLHRHSDAAIQQLEICEFCSGAVYAVIDDIKRSVKRKQEPAS